jgi:solute carrier family 31 (copper transporter), member 1
MSTMHRIVGQYVLLASLNVGAIAHDNGMNMNMDQGMSMNMGNMIMYLHFKPGDNLWFLGWAPSSAGAMVGTCIGILMLSMTERWLAAMRGVMEAHWHKRLVHPSHYCLDHLFSDSLVM